MFDDFFAVDAKNVESDKRHRPETCEHAMNNADVAVSDHPDKIVRKIGVSSDDRADKTFEPTFPIYTLLTSEPENPLVI